MQKNATIDMHTVGSPSTKNRTLAKFSQTSLKITTHNDNSPPLRQPGISTGNAIRQRAGKRVGQRRRTQKQSGPQPQLMPQVKETEQVRYTRPIRDLASPHQKPQRHHRPPGFGRGLHSRYQPPGKDAERGPAVRRHNFPHERKPSERDVRDVEYCKQPIIIVAGEVQVFLHAGDAGVSGYNISISFSHDSAFQLP